jgi:thymidine kinase
MELILILGCMFAGKSSELIRHFRRYSVLGKRILVVNHLWNVRNGKEPQVSTHDMCVLEHDNVLVTDKLEDIVSLQVLADVDVVIIEELQFFNYTGSDVYGCVKLLVETFGKTVIASGLDGCADRQPMGDIFRLIPFADEKIFLSALCRRCGDGTRAVFSSRLCTNNDNKPDDDNVDASSIRVGGSDKYEALCRLHYLEQNKYI